MCCRLSFEDHWKYHDLPEGLDREFAALILDCAAYNAADRPTFGEVLGRLLKICARCNGLPPMIAG